MKKITQKYQILLFFLLLSGCISVSDIIGTDQSDVEPVDEVGQLLSDIQQEETNSTLPELNKEPELEISEEKLDPSPTQEYDSVLLDQSLEQESSKEVIEPVVEETSENEKAEAVAVFLFKMAAPIPSSDFLAFFLLLTCGNVIFLNEIMRYWLNLNVTNSLVFWIVGIVDIFLGEMG